MKKTFPSRPLNKTLQRDASVDPVDVSEVKIFLQNIGLYEKPSYGMTPYPDEALFDGIKKYQSLRGLKVDGIIKVDGETQNQMRIDREELPPLKKMIPGTNIPDEGVPEQGWPKSKLNDFINPQDYDVDRGLEKKPPLDPMDPHIFLPPYNAKDPYFIKVYRHRNI